MESVWGTVPVSANNSHRKGAPMKMPTLLATANQKLRAFVRRRAFSERSRGLAERALPSAVLHYVLYEQRKLFVRRSFTRRPRLRVNKHQSGSLSRFPKAAPLVVEWGFQGGENRNSPLGESLLPFFSSRKEGPAPA